MPIEYPVTYYSRITGLTIEFTANRCGTVIHPGNTPYTVGYKSESWVDIRHISASWTPYNNSKKARIMAQLGGLKCV